MTETAPRSSADHLAMRPVSAEDRKVMGDPVDAKIALIEKSRAWRELRQPSIDTMPIRLTPTNQDAI